VATASTTAGSGGRRPDAEPDYDHATETINAARSENPAADAWRRADASASSGDSAPGAFSPADSAPGAFSPAAAASPDELSPDDIEDDEFDEPDADDPEDEPLPQAVRPADAVRVARMEAEVLVVDGRPRYHLADCPHLVGKLTEPIPVNEAIELGFSPCGLCRPVDRLAATAAHS
jgi:clumping factor A